MERVVSNGGLWGGYGDRMGIKTLAINVQKVAL
jgi:hypothetical protein